MLSHEQFLHKQIKKMLLDMKIDEAEATTAATYAVQYKQAHPRADVSILLSEAKRHAKQIHLPGAPSVKREIKPARLPAPKWRP
ncbi:hypothetical protein [Serratia fonticola]|uniref:hypothetical protein n=1 Tax=Serratia fonticola TaxID=47917 RepID=UPI0034C5FF21